MTWTSVAARSIAVLAFLCATSAVAFEIGLPLDCTLGRDCFVQNFVDVDPSPAGRDYLCQTRTYDGHKGTDFRLPDIAAMDKGVAVLAIAEGTVLRVRDGMADRLMEGAPAPSIKNRECGNGLVIDHGGGWMSQYCHLKRNSVRVRPGDRVARGAGLGEIGLSGKTAFPHVHLTLRRNGTVVDPVTGDLATEGCGDPVGTLFEAGLAEAIAAQTTTVLNSGFATSAVSMAQIERGTAAATAIGRDAPALVFYARAIWLQAGDRPSIELFGPSGELLVADSSKPVNRDKAQWMSFAGKRRPAGGWPPGRYHARYRILRDDKPILEFSRHIEIP